MLDKKITLQQKIILMIKSYVGSQYIDQSDINHVENALHQKAITNGISVLKLKYRIWCLNVSLLSCNSGTSTIHMVCLPLV